MIENIPQALNEETHHMIDETPLEEVFLIPNKKAQADCELRYKLNNDDSEIARIFESIKTQKESPLGTQVGGGHYKQYAIQPIEFIHKNNVPYAEANVIKYVMRHKQKNGVEDLKKAIHYIQLLAEMEYGVKL